MSCDNTDCLALLEKQHLFFARWVGLVIDERNKLQDNLTAVQQKCTELHLERSAIRARLMNLHAHEDT